MGERGLEDKFPDGEAGGLPEWQGKEEEETEGRGVGGGEGRNYRIFDAPRIRRNYLG